MLVSWVQQCGFQPPAVSVAVKGDRPLNAWLDDGAAFTLNVLDDSQTDMISHFGRGFGLDEPAFSDLEVEQFAVAATLLVDLMLYGEVMVRYSALREADKVYHEAERWFERHTPEQVKAWMQYVLCF